MSNLKINLIKKLTLEFPHGASIEACSTIARFAEKHAEAGVSEGGMAHSGIPLSNDESWNFSEDEVVYTYGHNRRKHEET